MKTFPVFQIIHFFLREKRLLSEQTAPVGGTGILEREFTRDEQ
jgi:hypothetical protein